MGFHSTSAVERVYASRLTRSLCPTLQLTHSVRRDPRHTQFSILSRKQKTANETLDARNRLTSSSMVSHKNQANKSRPESPKTRIAQPPPFQESDLSLRASPTQISIYMTDGKACLDVLLHPCKTHEQHRVENEVLRGHTLAPASSNAV